LFQVDKNILVLQNLAVCLLRLKLSECNFVVMNRDKYWRECREPLPTANCCRAPAGYSDRRCSWLPIFMTSVVANVPEVDLREMLVSGCGIDPNFGLPEPGMDPPIRPQIGKG